MLSSVLTRCFGHGIKLTYRVVTDKAHHLTQDLQGEPSNKVDTRRPTDRANQSPTPMDAAPQDLDPQLDPHKTFNNYLEGDSNKLPRSIGLSIAEHPNTTQFNPMFIYGPSGCGKTTLASIVANTTGSEFVKLNAVTSGVKDVREVIAAAEDNLKLYGRETYLLLDECHRWSKAQSDSILPALERGIIKFIGSTTENPMVSMTGAIVSRCRVVRFHPLTEEACQKRLIALGQSPEMAKKKARIAEGCVGRALEIDDGQLDLRMELTHNVFSVHHPADALGVVNMYKEDKERQKLVLDTLEIALRDILVQQAGGASVADAGYAREALDYASRVPLSGGLTLMETLRRARVMLASNVAFTSAFETVLLQISEEYAKWPW